MHFRISRLPSLTLATILVTVATNLFSKSPNEQDIQKIKDALPQEAPAKPKKVRKILIFSKTNGFRHGSIATGAKAIHNAG